MRKDRNAERNRGLGGWRQAPQTRAHRGLLLLQGDHVRLSLSFGVSQMGAGAVPSSGADIAVSLVVMPEEMQRLLCGWCLACRRTQQMVTLVRTLS